MSGRVICVSASAFGEGGSGRPAGRGLRSPSAWPATSGLGGCRRRRGRGGCRGGPVVSGVRAGCRCGARFSLLGPAALVFSSRPSCCVCASPRVCLCVGGSLGTRGSLSHLPRRRHCLWLPPRRRVPAGPAAATPGSRGRGCRSPLSSLLFGAPRLPLSPTSRPSVRLGVGTSPRRPPPASHGNLPVGVRPLPRGVKLGELRGCGRPTPPLHERVPLPQTHTSALCPAGVWQGAESLQVRARAPRRLGHPQLLRGSRSRGEAEGGGRKGVRAGGGVDRAPLPAYTWAQVKAPGGDGDRAPAAACLPFPLPAGLRRQRREGGTPARRPPPPPPHILGLCCRCARAPRLPHCGSRGPINRESDVLGAGSREAGERGRGRPSHRLPRPCPGHVSAAAGSHPVAGGGSLPPGVTWRGSGDPSSWDHVGGCRWDTCGAWFDRPGGCALGKVELPPAAPP